MKIVHIAPFYHPVIGGVEEVVKKVAEYMASRGNEICVVTYNRARTGSIGGFPREEIINGVHVIRLKPDFIWSHGTYSSELPEVLRKLEPDLVHVHVWRHMHVFQVAKLKKRLNFKAILHTHAPFHKLNQLGIVTWLYHRAIDMLLKNILKEYDRLIALTPHEKNILVRKLDVEKEKIVVIPNGIDDELVNSPYNMSGTETSTVLYLGRISRSKNVDLLAKAMTHVKKSVPDARLVMAGPDEGLVGKLESCMQRRGVDFRYLGTVSEYEKRRLYSKCTIFAHPALYEPFGITLLEAQAFGKPCVITGKGGQLYAAPPGKTSLYAEPNPSAFAKAISTLLTNKQLYERLSVNTRIWAPQHTWSRILPRYEEIYDQLCA